MVFCLDCAPVHLGEDWRARMASELAHVRLMFIVVGYTSVFQPLDRSAMRPAKSYLRRLVAEKFASELLKCETGEQCVIDFSVPAQKVRFPCWLQSVLLFLKSRPKINEYGWRFSREFSFAETVKMSLTALEQGTPFRKFRATWPRSMQRQEMKLNARLRPATRENASWRRRRQRRRHKKNTGEMADAVAPPVEAEVAPQDAEMPDVVAPPVVLTRHENSQTQRLLALRLVYRARAPSQGHPPHRMCKCWRETE